MDRECHKSILNDEIARVDIEEAMAMFMERISRAGKRVKKEYDMCASFIDEGTKAAEEIRRLIGDGHDKQI